MPLPDTAEGDCAIRERARCPQIMAGMANGRQQNISAVMPRTRAQMASGATGNWSSAVSMDTSRVKKHEQIYIYSLSGNIGDASKKCRMPNNLMARPGSQRRPFYLDLRWVYHSLLLYA